MAMRRTQAMRFSREIVNGTEWFIVRWEEDSPEAMVVEHHIPTAERLKAWLVSEQKYSTHEADSLVDRLRQDVD
jgi:hypothetical protein